MKGSGALQVIVTLRNGVVKFWVAVFYIHKVYTYIITLCMHMHILQAEVVHWESRQYYCSVVFFQMVHQ